MSSWDGTPELAELLDAARRKLERNWLRIEDTVDVTASPLAPELWRLCTAIRGGRAKSFTKKITVPLTEIDRWLHDNTGQGLLATLGPLTNKKLAEAEKSAYREHWPREIRSRLGEGADEFWVEWLRSSGKFVQQNYFPALRAAPEVLKYLPAEDIALTELAERATGDTKALGRDGRLASIVLHALALKQGVPRPDSVEAERAVWEAAGVIVDTLSSQVMVLGMRARDEHLLGRFLNESAEAGLPFVITLDQLTRFPVTGFEGPVFVCENPAVLAAAARTLGAQCPALICTQGQPSATARRLLAACSDIHWRGDFDWTGLRTTAAAIDRYLAVPWLMDADTYRTASNRGPSESFKESDLLYDATWDTELSALMRATGRAVMEERIIPELLASLRAASTA
ncbi:TIGR02679 family protein [Rhodococcus tibetensis]|uniref:TIGR02679 family protein n=1 Tax=Rhodococcus tibetensis TaxID=2965064 RepID=A0ABT1QCV3_9NOCA|nr:TIGR02679 family protein [Rhodococcus sp. FXJ9.536]MCQ4120099.1 TIGR02679 family protein [Rhodococcus sp. FXJ9.536]